MQSFPNANIVAILAGFFASLMADVFLVERKEGLQGKWNFVNLHEISSPSKLLL